MVSTGIFHFVWYSPWITDPVLSACLCFYLWTYICISVIVSIGLIFIQKLNVEKNDAFFWIGWNEEEEIVTIIHQKKVLQRNLRNWGLQMSILRLVIGVISFRTLFSRCLSICLFLTGLMLHKFAATGTRYFTCLTCGDVLNLNWISQLHLTWKLHIQSWSNRLLKDIQTICSMSASR